MSIASYETFITNMQLAFKLGVAQNTVMQQRKRLGKPKAPAVNHFGRMATRKRT